MQERKALNVQLETLRKADRCLTRDPEIASLIGSSDDDLLYELRKETAEEKLSGKPKKSEKELLDMTPPEMPQESPKSAAEILKEKEEQQRKEAAAMPKPSQPPMQPQHPAQNNPPHQAQGPPQYPNPTAAPPTQHPSPPKQPPAKTNLFGSKGH